MALDKVKTEHAGAKNGGGGWGLRADMKRASRKRRRREDRAMTSKATGGKPVVKGPVDGNAFSVMGAVTKALKAAGQGDRVDEYRKRAMSGDYNHLLAVSMEYVDFRL